MRARISRHLAPALESGLHVDVTSDGLPPEEFNWPEYVVMLLHTAAEIEHSLMVQYLFAAYSLGGPEVPEAMREDVRAWQETILGVAKEEMGHLITTQNLLLGFGAPLNLGREDYPWGSEFYPFPFTLERLSLQTVAAYVCAESPPTWEGDEATEIKRLAARGTGGTVNRVGVLYETLLAIVKDPQRIPDSMFRSESVPRQASWDEWGRGFRQGGRGNVPDVASPDLLILTAWSRSTVQTALEEIGEQGEALGAVSGTDPSDAGEESHFTRFLDIYRRLEELDEEDRQRVTRPLAPNPVAVKSSDREAPAAPVADLGEPVQSRIEDPVALLWAHLFNLRYRMLLANLAHALGLADASVDDGTVTPRGGLVNRTFSEMYNLRVIAGMLVQLPLVPGVDGVNAGPPFQMPYRLGLPGSERDRWILHRNLLDASALLVDRLLPCASATGRDYLTALAEADANLRRQVDLILGGQVLEPAR